MTAAESTAKWRQPTTFGEVRARANGRTTMILALRARAQLRRAKIAKTLKRARRHFMAEGNPPLDWPPRGLVRDLAKLHRVSRQTIGADIAIIEGRAEEPRRKLDDPRWRWLHERIPRPRTFTHLFALKLSDEQHAWLWRSHEPAKTLRRAIDHAMGREGQSAGPLDEAALLLAQALDPDSQDRLVRTAEQLKLPLAQVIASLLTAQLRPGKVSPRR